MYEPDKKLCENFINYFSNNNSKLNVERGVVDYGVSHFRVYPHYAKQKYVGLAEVETKADYRGTGNGTKMLKAICQWLDAKKLTCEVYPESYGDQANDRKLRQWYKRHGFKALSGKNTMVRKPK